MHSDRLYPMESILQDKTDGFVLESNDQLVRDQWIGRTRSEVQEERSAVFENSLHFLCPIARPFEVILTAPVVVVSSVPDPQVVRWRGDDKVHRSRLQFFHSLDAVNWPQVMV